MPNNGSLVPGDRAGVLPAPPRPLLLWPRSPPSGDCCGRRLTFGGCFPKGRRRLGPDATHDAMGTRLTPPNLPTNHPTDCRYPKLPSPTLSYSRSRLLSLPSSLAASSLQRPGPVAGPHSLRNCPPPPPSSHLMDHCYFIDPGCSLESAERTSTQVTHRANCKKRLTVLYIVEHPNQEGDTCIDWTSQYCWTNGWNCLWRGHSVYRNRPLIPPLLPPSTRPARGLLCRGSLGPFGAPLDTAKHQVHRLGS